jgi:hypothetical protein
MSIDLFMEAWSDAFLSISKCFMKSDEDLSITLGHCFIIIFLVFSFLLVILNMKFHA